jgi:hypothetical protein
MVSILMAGPLYVDLALVKVARLLAVTKVAEELKSDIEDC